MHASKDTYLFKVLDSHVRDQFATKIYGINPFGLRESAPIYLPMLLLLHHMSHRHVTPRNPQLMHHISRTVLTDTTYSTYTYRHDFPQPFLSYRVFKPNPLYFLFRAPGRSIFGGPNLPCPHPVYAYTVQRINSYDRPELNR